MAVIRDALRIAALLVGGWTLTACGETYSEEDVAYEEYDSSYSGEEEPEPFDEDAAREAAEEDLAAEGYDYSYGCTDDCSGHEAGWQWRAENGYSTYGNSQSFEEGGYAFDDALEDRVEEMRDDYEADVDPY